MIPEQRREQIISWLREDHLLRIDELADRLRVSAMTVHRDLDTLVEMGLVEKIHGGARLPEANKLIVEACDLCDMPIKPRLSFVITTRDGQTCRACCPHCGLLLLHIRPDAALALVKDFLYGKVINVRQAYFVIESRVSFCCEPGVLAFANETDAQDFQKGFGGRVMAYVAAQAYLTESH